MLAGGMVAFAGIRANAVVANPDPSTFTQPDGTEVTLRLFGDESYNYTMTADGYAVSAKRYNRNLGICGTNRRRHACFYRHRCR